MNCEDLDYWLFTLKKSTKISKGNFNKEAEAIFIKRGLAEITDQTGPGEYQIVITKAGRDFPGFCIEETNRNKQKWRDELNERAVKSAESSAISSKKSAEASMLSAECAKEANVLSNLAIKYSRYGIWIAVISLIATILGIIFK